MLRLQTKKLFVEAAAIAVAAAGLGGCYGNRMDGQPVTHLADNSSARAADLTNSAISESAETASYRAGREALEAREGTGSLTTEERRAAAEPAEMYRVAGGVSGGRGAGSAGAGGATDMRSGPAGGGGYTQGSGGGFSPSIGGIEPRDQERIRFINRSSAGMSGGGSGAANTPTPAGNRPSGGATGGPQGGAAAGGSGGGAAGGSRR